MSIRRSKVAPMVVAALIAALAGCSSADNSAACKELQTTMADLTQRAAVQTDAAGVEKLYSDEAASLRKIADEKAGGDVQSAAKQLADSLEKLGHALGGSSTRPDTGSLVTASDALEKACT